LELPANTPSGFCLAGILKHPSGEQGGFLQPRTRPLVGGVAGQPTLPERTLSYQASLSFVFPFLTFHSFSLVRFLSSWDRPGRRATESLQQVNITWTAAGNGQKVRRHSLYRLNSSTIKQKKNHAIRLKEGKKAMGRLRRLAGHVGLLPVNCRKVLRACIQSLAMFGSELWWKGDGVVGTVGRAEELQKLVNQQALAVTGCLRITNQGALAMESGLRPAAAQLANRQRRFRLRLLGLPQGDQAKKVVGAASGIGKRLKNALAYIGRTESTVLLEESEALDAVTIQEDEKSAKVEAESIRPGLTVFTDGSRLDSGAVGYAVAWQEWAILGGHQYPHGQQPRSLRRGVRRIGTSSGDGGEATNDTGESHHFHQRPSRHQTNGIGGTRPRLDVRPTRHHHRDRVVSRPQGRPRERDG
jgi:hypothetical protein